MFHDPHITYPWPDSGLGIFSSRKRSLPTCAAMSTSGITSESFSISDADGDSYFFWAGDGARELLPWTAGPGAQKNLDPEHPLARDSKGRGLALAAPSIFLFNTVCVVSSSLALCISHPLPIPRGPPCPRARVYVCECRGGKRSKVSPRGALKLPAARFLQTGRFDPLFLLVHFDMMPHIFSAAG